MEKKNQSVSADNSRIYNLLRAVPESAQKQFSNGRFSGTDINPMWRIEKLTEVFGMCGFGWYTDVVTREFKEAPDGSVAAFIAINLFIKQDGEWSKPIYGEGGNTFASKNKSGVWNVSDEAMKMAYTDALSNATKAIGLGADIWFSKSETKYTQIKQEQVIAKPVNLDNAISLINNSKSVDELKGIWDANKDLQSNTSFINCMTTKKKELSA